MQAVVSARKWMRGSRKEVIYAHLFNSLLPFIYNVPVHNNSLLMCMSSSTRHARGGTKSTPCDITGRV